MTKRTAEPTPFSFSRKKARVEGVACDAIVEVCYHGNRFAAHLILTCDHEDAADTHFYVSGDRRSRFPGTGHASEAAYPLLERTIKSDSRMVDWFWAEENSSESKQEFAELREIIRRSNLFEVRDADGGLRGSFDKLRDACCFLAAASDEEWSISRSDGTLLYVVEYTSLCIDDIEADAQIAHDMFSC